MNRFRIVNVLNPELAWSNVFGWIDADEDDWDTFTLEESETLDLPLDGAWERF
jgi:hypothetical protein